jgi:hypothetical protein
MRTPEDRLESVDAAIQAIEEGGQSYTINGLTYTRADLETLYAQHEALRAEVARRSYGDRVLVRWARR